MADMDTPLTLSTICGGSLEQHFQRLYPALLGQCKEGDKASVSITVEFERVKDTTTMVKTKFKLSPKFPATSKASLCQFDNDFRVRTEPAPERPKVVTLFSEGGNANV